MTTTRREMLEQEAKRIENSSKRSDARFWKAKVGKNTIRILPHWTGDEGKVFYEKCMKHFGVGPDMARIRCRKSQNSKEECPICEFVAQLKSSGDTLFKELVAKDRYYLNIIDVEAPQNGVQIWEVGAMVMGTIFSLFTDVDENIDSLDKGRHIIIRRVGEGKMDTKYTVMASGTVTKIDPRVMAKAHNLSEFSQIPTVEEAIAALRGDDDDFPPAAKPEDDFNLPPSEEDVVENTSTESEDVLSIPLGDEEEAPKAQAATPVSRKDKLDEMRSKMTK